MYSNDFTGSEIMCDCTGSILRYCPLKFLAILNNYNDWLYNEPKLLIEFYLSSLGFVSKVSIPFFTFLEHPSIPAHLFIY